MNKHLYRVIFNKARGLLMVVAENVSADGKAGASAAGAPGGLPAGVTVSMHPLRYALMLVLGLILPGGALAAIVADASAPAHQQPSIIPTANGVPQIDIQTPSAAGVSRNTYSAFDVDPRGAILNNSRTDIQTQLGGWISGNQKLNNGTARIILNEVNSSAASHLSGYVEVAGDRAQVVIANPAGISCAGCGFINANRATLTTGSPILTEGRLDGYSVSKGEIRIEGAGLDGRATEYTDLIARAVRVNAGIWANDLRVTTGSNRVDTDHSQAVSLASLGDKPEFAIDVAHLGGMYAGKIRLVGTEHGVGERNAGTLAAESSNLVVTLDGRLENTGLLQGKQDIQLTTEGGVRNSGTLSAQRELLLGTTADLDNSAGRINAARLDISAQSLNNRDGDLEQTGTQVLAIIAESLTNREAGRIGVAETSSGTGSESGSGSTPSAPETGSTPPSNGNNTAGGTPEPAPIEQLADGQLLIGELLDNDAGRLLAGGKVTLTTENLNNDEGRLGVHQLSVNGGELSNQAGELTVTTDADITATRMSNDAGSLSVGGALALRAGELSNRDGKLIHSDTSSTALQVSGRFDNTGGLFATNADNLTLNANVLVNEDGRLEHVGEGTLAITATSLEGRAGSLLSNGALEITGENTDLRAGTTSARRIAIDTGTLTTAQGTLVASGDEALTLTARERLNNDGGTIATDGALSLNAGALSNREGLIAISGGAASEIRVAGEADNSAGVMTSSGALSLHAGDLLNAEGLVHTADGSSLAVQIAGTLDNGSDGALVSGGSLTLSSGQLDNQGGLIQAQGDATLQAERVDNTAGLILATQALDVTSQSLINRATLSDDTVLGLQGQTVALQAQQLDNSGGLISADQSLSVEGQGTGSSLSNEGGKLSSSGSLDVLVDSIRNAGGTVLAGVRNFIQTGSLTGSGRLLSHGDLSLKVSQDFVQTGEIVANGQADVSSDGRLTNQGSIEAGALRVQAANIDNTATGEISGGDVRVSASSTLTNRGLIDGQQTRLEAAQVENIGSGRIYGDHLAIQAQTLINREESVGDATQAGTIAARERLDLGVGTLINQEQALIFSAGSGDNALNIGGALDDNGHAVGRADSVHNASATIESLGGLSLASSYLLNSNEHFSTIEALTLKPTAITYIQPSGDANKYNISNFVWRSWSRAGYYRWKDDPDVGEAGVLGKSPIPRVGENDCIGEGDAEVCVRLPGADYLPDDPAWAYFKLPAPAEEPAKPVSTDFEKAEDFETALADWRTAQAAWQAETDARYERLDARIETYNNQFEGRKIKDWTQYQVTRTEHTTQVTESAPALIRSGGNMRLTGDELINDKSRIVAGGALTGDLQSLNNIDAIGKHRVHEEGTSQSSRSRWRGGFKRYHERRWGDLVAYRPADIVTSFNLNVVGVETNTQAQGTGNQIAAHSATVVKDSFKGISAAVPLLIGKLPQNPVEPSAAPENVGPVGSVWDLPTSSLFKVSPGGGGFLVETDPRFTNQRTWLNSDYLLGQLSLDAAGMQQRIGDGFYEQWLIREQVSQLTGRRYLENYSDDEAQYRALMEAGVTLAQDWNLRPGVALSAEQLARLTSDIVWLVEETVRLPDGTYTTALVPKVYLVPREGDLDGNGTLISAESVDLRLEGDLVNSGTIAGRGVVQLSGDNLRNLGGRISGADVLMQARTDLENLGGTLDAQDSLLLSAGRDLTVASTTQSASEQVGKSDFSRTDLDRVAGLYVSNPGGTLVMAAGRDVTLTGAEVTNAGAGGQTLISAGRDLTLASVQTSLTENSVADKNNYLKLSRTEEKGTHIDVAGDLVLMAGNDLAARAAQLNSEAGAVQLSAGNDISLTEGESTLSFSEAHKDTRSGVLGSTTTTRQYTEDQRVTHGTEISGQSVHIQAGNDIALIGSHVDSAGSAVLVAAGNIQLLAEEDYSSQSSLKKTNGTLGRNSAEASASTSATAAVSSLSAGQNLILNAGQDLQSQGAQFSSDGTLQIIAGNDIHLGVAENHFSEDHAKSRNGLASGRARSESSEATLLTGSHLDARKIDVRAGHDLTLKASSLTADETARLMAGRDINLVTANEQQSSSSARETSKLGLSFNAATFVSGSLTEKDQQSHFERTDAIGNQLSAGQLLLSSGRDTTVEGSTLVADGAINIAAGRDLLITSAESHETTSSKSSSRKVGDVGEWYAPSYGRAKQSQSETTSSTQQIGSQIASLGGNITLSAGDRYQQTASDVLALDGDIAIYGKQVVIEAGYDQFEATHTSSMSTTALGGSVSVPVLDAARSLYQLNETTKNTNDARLQTLAAATAAMKVSGAVDDAMAMANGDMGIKVSVSLGNNRSSSTTTQRGQNAVDSTVNAAGNLSIVATGAGADSDIHVVGSQLKAGGNAHVEAEGDIVLEAAKNTAQQESDNSSSGWSVGVGFTVGGTANGFTIDLAANKARGSADGSDVSWSNSAIQAGNRVDLISGGDTTLKGAVVSGERVVADIGGDLNIESLQDTSTYDAEQTSMGVGVSLCIPGFCAGASSVSASYNQQKIDSTYASVSEQSGIKAGDGGFDIRVEGNTDLKGAVIASSQAAVDGGLNTLDTGTLTSSDIRNYAEYDASSLGLSGGYSFGGGSGESNVGTDADGNAQAGAAGKPLPSEGGFSATTPIALSAGDSDSSTTHSGISGGNLIVRDADRQQRLTGKTAEQTVADLKRDVTSEQDGSNTQKTIFDLEEVQTGFAITTAFVQETGTYVERKAKESAKARNELKEERAKPPEEQDQARIAELQETLQDNKTWEMGGTGRTLLTAFSIAAGGNVTGSGTELLQSATVNYLQALGAQEVKSLVEQFEGDDGARAALHAVVGCMGAEAQGVSCGSAALGASSAVVVNALLDSLYGEEGAALSPDQKEARENLVTSLVAGVTAAAGGDAAVASAAAQIETENNSLLKAAKITYKVAKSALESYQKNGKIKASDLKETLKDEGLSIIDNLLTLTDEEITIDDALAILDLVVGTEFNKANAGEAARRIAEIQGKYGVKAAGSAGAEVPVVRISTGNAVKGSPEFDLLNNPGARAANTRYELDNGNSFKTNSAGQVEELTFTPVNTKVPRDARQTEAGKQGRDTDVGGHAQACSQGGTCDGYNLFPQDKNFNNSAYKVFYEHEIKRALDDPAKTVGPTTITFNRSVPNSPRPDTLSVTYTVDGKTKTRIFENEANKIPWSQ